jgi:cysteine desulfurase
MAIKGIAHFYRDKKRHVITSQTDHKCVLDSCRHLQQAGWDVTYLPVQQNGLVDLAQLEVRATRCCRAASTARLTRARRQAAMREDTALVSIMAINNEIGVLQPLAEIGALCRSKKIFFHTDAAQAIGKVPLDVNALNIDAMSISGHKARLRCVAPLRHACLTRAVRRSTGPRAWAPSTCGGGRACALTLLSTAAARSAACAAARCPRRWWCALREGAGCARVRTDALMRLRCCSQVGLGAACEVARTEMARDEAHVRHLSERLLAGLRARLPHIILNGDAPARYPGNLNISFAYVEGESLLMARARAALRTPACGACALTQLRHRRAQGLKDIAVSSGSACTSASLEPSYVLRALGVEDDLAHTSLRFGLGRFTTESEVDHAIDATARHVQKLRDMSPLWEMVQEGIDLKSINWTQHH